MPIYEYRCESCGHQLEAMQKMSDPVLTECPECKAAQLKKLMSAGGFRMKSSSSAAACPVAGDMPACGAGACPACE